MWNGGMMNPPPPPPPPQHGGNSGGVKHDIFVGNLSFGTTEEQLHQAFSEIGKVVKVRLVNDNDTGKPRGFAFVEFEDPQAALSAIRNMNDYELNGRRIRVNFSNSSHLEELANELGMDLSQPNNQSKQQKQSNASAGTTAVADSLKNMSKGEMYDVVAKLKEIADRDPDEARRILSGHPQLPEAMLFLMSKLDMVKTPLPDMMQQATAVPMPNTMPRDPRARPPADPRQRAAPPPPPPPPMDPRQAPPMDPRQQAPMDPRQRAPPPPSGGALDPALVQQVMSLTPQQIAQLPPEKQQSILALRQQITGGR